MKLPDKVTPEDIIQAVENDENTGFCLACGEQHYHIEPDARRYKCDTCGENLVFGAAELIFMLS